VHIERPGPPHPKYGSPGHGLSLVCSPATSDVRLVDHSVDARCGGEANRGKTVADDLLCSVLRDRSGVVPQAVTNCLNFGSPEDPHVMWQFAELATHED
jgi:hypothetical protein